MIRMTATRTLTASQSPTGKQIDRGKDYEVDTASIARDHERRGMGARSAAVKPAASEDARK